VEITWDDIKADENFRKHKVPFPEAKSAMQDPLARVAPDDGHSDAEDRFTLIAESTRQRILIITFTINNDDSARLISARRASAAERRNYMAKRPDHDVLGDRDLPNDDGIIIDEPLPAEGWLPNPFRFGPNKPPYHALISAGVSDAYRTDHDVNEALWFILEKNYYKQFKEWRDARTAAQGNTTER